jgi:serine/threonine protein kinase/Flp pilus assembly protein TadD
MAPISELRTPAPAPPADPGERLAADMAADWARGECHPAEHYLAPLPEPRDSSEGAVRLIYEEVCLRRERGEEVASEELARRFPRWAGELAVILECHRLVVAGLAPLFPAAGESLGEFRLVSELGRGGRGRVFLATQPALAGRAVVLKVTPRQDREFLSLARLQHTNIIPLLGAYDFPERNLRGLCQPYLGGTTLERLLEMLGREPLARRTGASLVGALDEACRGSPLPPARRGPPVMLSGRSYAEAICWLGACLADALEHAHERGLVHLDIKPSNVLLAADGQPLLLDFHLARHPVPAGRGVQEGLGGTPAYMSPEQRAAFEAGQVNLPLPAPVDSRSDIWSLGRLLYEALGGKCDGIALPRLDWANPGVSVGLADIVHCCLAADPATRYPSAGELAADLRRHLAGLPLCGVANRSLPERWRKWRRRRPHAPLWVGLLLALAGGVALGVATGVELLLSAREALAEGQQQLGRGACAEAARTLDRARMLADGLPGGSALVGDIDGWLGRARKAAAAERLHAVCERLRFIAVTKLTEGDLRALDSLCSAAWESRHLVAGLPDSAADERAREDLADLALLWADLKRRLAKGPEPAEVRGLLAEAEALCRWKLTVARGQRAPARTPRERVLSGRDLLCAGELDLAAKEFERAADLRPQDFWAHFYGGVCAHRRRQYPQAVHSFGMATALAPNCAEVYHNRGLAHVALGNLVAARRDYDRALALAPGLSAASMNRGILNLEDGRLDLALADLERALRDGADPAATHYNLALVRLARGEKSLARRSVGRALERAPGHAEARRLAERLAREK